MIRCEPVPEPVDFRAKAEEPGNAWLAANPAAKRPKDYWTPFKPALAQGFRDRCAYSAMYEPVGTVDHFVSWHEDRSKAYEWGNYRYCAAWVNASKSKKPVADILDPFEIENGWFELLLPSLQYAFRAPFPTSCGTAPSTCWTDYICATTNASCVNGVSGTACIKTVNCPWRVWRRRRR